MNGGGGSPKDRVALSIINTVTCKMNRFNVVVRPI